MVFVETLKDLGEFGFIRRVSRGCTVREEGVVLGVGDDAAALEPSPGELLLVTTDLLVEGIHFRRAWTTGLQLGHKALAVNLSDIAAMGGTAREAFVSLAVPQDTETAFLDDLYEGMKALAQAYGLNILGGDTTGSSEGLVINVTVLGRVPQREILTRSGAQAGDALLLVGNVGESRAGLRLLTSKRSEQAKGFEQLLKAHLEPTPLLKEGRFLAISGAVHACIDVSDGLSSDLGHMTEASGVGARLFREAIPISENLSAYCAKERLDPIDFALAGGEDYALLVAVASEAIDAFRSDCQNAMGEDFHVIGEVADTGGLELEEADGRTSPLSPTGWNHFG